MKQETIVALAFFAVAAIGMIIHAIIDKYKKTKNNHQIFLKNQVVKNEIPEKENEKLLRRIKNSELSLKRMEREYMASKNLKSLSSEQKDYIMNKFQELQEAKLRMEEIKRKEERRILEEKIMKSLRTEGEHDLKGTPQERINAAVERLKGLLKK